MSNKIRLTLFGAGVFLIILVVLFLSVQFIKTKEKNAVYQRSNSTIESIQTPAVPSAPVSGDRNEVQKTIFSTVPILMYHYIRDYSNVEDPIGINLSVSPSKFEQQMAWLAGNNYKTIPLIFLKDPVPVDFKPIILTFDDGYQDAYNVAFPILKKYKMAGTFYVIVDKIGTLGYLTWDEIIQMQTEGMFFGSHTLSHPDLRNLSKINLHRELEESKNILEQKLGRVITDFCYPSGKYNDVVLKELQDDNYQTAVTTNPGISNVEGDLLLLKRLRVTNNTYIWAIVEK